MLWMPDTLGALISCVTGMAEALGENALIGHVGLDAEGEFLDVGLVFGWVCFRQADSQIVGDEGGDYRIDPKTEENAIALYCGKPPDHQQRKTIFYDERERCAQIVEQMVCDHKNHGPNWPCLGCDVARVIRSHGVTRKRMNR